MIDLRSDTVTKPTREMRDVMATAPVGDDVYGEDPTVNKLESLAAGMAGMEAGIFVSSGTQSNLLALLSHCERGDEYIAGQDAHTYRYEGGGAAVLGSIQPQPCAFNAQGELDLDLVKQLIKPIDNHFARTRLLCLENTQGGKVLSLDYLHRAREMCLANDLSLHLDGARVFNAAVKLGVPLADISSQVDSISICLSKGLGAPVGSVLCGKRELIAKARRWRKVLGGGMRQSGIIAAAGIYALEHHIDRLAIDHRHAEEIASGLQDLAGIQVLSVNTNMLMIETRNGDFTALRKHLAAHDILISGGRLVTHLDIGDTDIPVILSAFSSFSNPG